MDDLLWRSALALDDKDKSRLGILGVEYDRGSRDDLDEEYPQSNDYFVWAVDHVVIEQRPGGGISTRPSPPPPSPPRPPRTPSPSPSPPPVPPVTPGTQRKRVTRVKRALISPDRSPALPSPTRMEVETSSPSGLALAVLRPLVEYSSTSELEYASAPGEEERLPSYAPPTPPPADRAEVDEAPVPEPFEMPPRVRMSRVARGKQRARDSEGEDEVEEVEDVQDEVQDEEHVFNPGMPSDTEYIEADAVPVIRDGRTSIRATGEPPYTRAEVYKCAECFWYLHDCTRNRTMTRARKGRGGVVKCDRTQRQGHPCQQAFVGGRLVVSLEDARGTSRKRKTVVDSQSGKKRVKLATRPAPNADDADNADDEDDTQPGPSSRTRMRTSRVKKGKARQTVQSSEEEEAESSEEEMPTPKKRKTYTSAAARRQREEQEAEEREAERQPGPSRRPQPRRIAKEEVLKRQEKEQQRK